jgi:hypothetical protein
MRLPPCEHHEHVATPSVHEETLRAPDSASVARLAESEPLLRETATVLHAALLRGRIDSPIDRHDAHEQRDGDAQGDVLGGSGHLVSAREAARSRHAQPTPDTRVRRLRSATPCTCRDVVLKSNKRRSGLRLDDEAADGLHWPIQ